MKILINTPHLKKLGGVANHYKGLKKFWSEEVTYNSIGGRMGIPGPLILIYDYFKFFFLCIFGSYEIIILNPSLGSTALKRDAIFLKIAKWFKIKTVIFFHGWDENLAQQITKKPEVFVKNFNGADAFIVLASNFREQIKDWGISLPIYLSTTKVDDDLLGRFDLDQKTCNKTILFLARIEENKGIFTTLSTFKEVVSKYPDAKLKVAGNGSSLERAKHFTINHEIPNVEFLGNISGKALKNSFSVSSIYLLPTQHGEGMPTSVLEAMAFGLTIISRPVGGLKDFFRENEMGFLLESVKPEDYASKIIGLLEKPEKVKEIGAYNYTYARRNFLASKVVLQLEKILGDVRG